MTEPTQPDGRQPPAIAEETESAQRLLAHCADALGMGHQQRRGSRRRPRLAENILEFIGFAEEWLDTDSRTRIADRLLEALEADTVADPDAWPTAIAAALGITPDKSAALVEGLLHAALTTKP